MIKKILHSLSILIVSAEYLSFQDNGANERRQSVDMNDFYSSGSKSSIDNIQLKHVYRYEVKDAVDLRFETDSRWQRTHFGRMDIDAEEKYYRLNAISLQSIGETELHFDPFDRETIFALAKMCHNTYFDPTDVSKWIPVEGYRKNISFGYEGSGIRGYIFGSPTDNLMIIAIKGNLISVTLMFNIFKRHICIIFRCRIRSHKQERQISR